MLLLALVIYLVFGFICTVAIISACILSGRIESAGEVELQPTPTEAQPLAAESSSPADRPASASGLALQSVH